MFEKTVCDGNNVCGLCYNCNNYYVTHIATICQCIETRRYYHPETGMPQIQLLIRKPTIPETIHAVFHKRIILAYLNKTVYCINKVHQFPEATVTENEHAELYAIFLRIVGTYIDDSTLWNGTMLYCESYGHITYLQYIQYKCRDFRYGNKSPRNVLSMILLHIHVKERQKFILFTRAINTGNNPIFGNTDIMRHIVYFI